MKNDEIKQQNHNKIKATASVLFFINGIEATNMYQIAAASGISKVSLYKYYESKYDIARDLIFDALEDTSRRFKEKWKVVPDETGAQELKRLLEYMTSVSEEDMPFSALFMEYAIYLQRFHAGSAAELFEKFDGNSRPCFLAAIEKGRKDGSLGGSESAELLYGTVTDAIRGSCASFFLRNAGDLTTAKLRRLKAQLRHIADAFLAETQNKG